MKQIINYDKLIVNPENYRFDPVDGQEQAIDLMIEEKGAEILNMAKHILEKGLDQAKDLRVLELKNKEYLVLDGNRRIVAIKCLHNPELVKNKKLQNAFKSLLKTGKKPISKILCFVYLNEKDAAEWIKLDHTGKNDGVGQDSWGSPEKERFGYKFEGTISPAMQAVNIIEKELGKKINTKKLKISTVNRILSSPDARLYVGVNVDKGNLTFTCDKNEAIKRLDTLVDKIITSNVTVGTVYHKPQIVEFVTDLYGAKPATCKKPTLPFPSVSNVSVGGKAVPGTLVKNDWIDYKEYTAYNGPEKVKKLLNEMRSLDPKQNANILMPALRVLLELCLYDKLRQTGHIVKLVNIYKSNIKNENTNRAKKGAALISEKKNWTPSFREMLNYIVEENSGVINDPQAREILEKKIKKEDNFVKGLNDFIHNVHDIPAKDDPEKTWSGFGRLLFDIIKDIK